MSAIDLTRKAEYATIIQQFKLRAINSAGECHLHMVEVEGSNPPSPTNGKTHRICVGFSHTWHKIIIGFRQRCSLKKGWFQEMLGNLRTDGINIKIGTLATPLDSKLPNKRPKRLVVQVPLSVYSKRRKMSTNFGDKSENARYAGKILRANERSCTRYCGGAAKFRICG